MSGETTLVAHACKKCGKEVENFSADPGLWPVWLSLAGADGETHCYHQKCVAFCDDERDTLIKVLRECVVALEGAGWHKCGCPGHWREHGMACPLYDFIKIGHSTLERYGEK